MQGELIGLIIAASVIVSGWVYMRYDLDKTDETEQAAIRARGAERAEARARAGEGAEEGAEEGAGRGSTGYDADSERSSIISNISEGDSYAFRGGGSRRKHRKSNKGSKGRKASKGNKGRKSRKHNNKKSKSKNSKSF
jgi:hypothetical protein